MTFGQIIITWEKLAKLSEGQQVIIGTIPSGATIIGCGMTKDFGYQVSYYIPSDVAVNVGGGADHGGCKIINMV